MAHTDAIEEELHTLLLVWAQASAIKKITGKIDEKILLGQNWVDDNCDVAAEKCEKYSYRIE